MRCADVHSKEKKIRSIVIPVGIVQHAFDKLADPHVL